MQVNSLSRVAPRRLGSAWLLHLAAAQYVGTASHLIMNMNHRCSCRWSGVKCPGSDWLVI